VTAASLTLIILVVTVLLMVSDRLAPDLVAVGCLLALYFTGVLTVEECLAGFSDSLVLFLAALFVLGGALIHTGGADRVGQWLVERTGRSYRAFVIPVMLVTATLSSMVSSTATMAILMPAVLEAARKQGRAARQVLLPMAYACLSGGTLTLVSTTPNLVASNALTEAGHPPFAFFAFTPFGLMTLGCCLLFFWFRGEQLFAEPPQENEPAPPGVMELVATHRLLDDLRQTQLPPRHRLATRTLSEWDLASQYSITLLGWTVPGSEEFHHADPRQRIAPESSLFFIADESDWERFLQAENLSSVDPVEFPHEEAVRGGGVVEIVLTSRSRWLGHTLRQWRFFQRYGARVLALNRRGEVFRNDFQDLPLRLGDVLLVGGSWPVLQSLARFKQSFVMCGTPVELARSQLNTGKQLLAVGIFLGMVGMLSLDMMPQVMAAMLCAAAVVLTRCLTPRQAYTSISWESIVLVACLLPLATALGKSGLLEMMASSLSGMLRGLAPGPTALLFLAVGVGISQLLSNTATAILLAPLALQVASELGASPRPFLMLVAIAASCPFLSPIGSPVNTLILGPGGYQTKDFLRAGLPIMLVVIPLAGLLVPLVFPFFP
jgi:di/tricarboxylate transporter